jgi:hypothetical protein
VLPGAATAISKNVKGDSMDAAAERRQYRRYAMRFPCAVRPWKKQGEACAVADEVKAVTVDISLGGIYLLFPFDWIKKGNIECLIRLPATTEDELGAGILCRGRIVRSEPREPAGMGLGVITEAYTFVQ